MAKHYTDEATLMHLAKLANKATPGHWMAVGTWVENTLDHRPDIVCTPCCDDRGPGDSHKRRKADAEYIAAAQPKQVKALVTEIRRLRAELSLVERAGE